MTPLELSTGLVLGGDQPVRLDGSALGSDALSALEAAVRPALERPPCLVSFSGGLDSSLVLATAMRVARREGLTEPIPATYRVKDAPTFDETSWQESVIRELGVTDWTVMNFTDELDVIGPVAAGLLRSHGVLFPFNLHGHAPLIRAASGGSLLTGAGGDEAFSPSARARAARVMTGRVRPGLRDALRVPFAYGPSSVRAAVLRRRFSAPFSWLTPTGLELFCREWAGEAAREPARWDASRRWWLARRYVRVLQEAFALLGADEDVAIHHPFCDPMVVQAVATAGGPAGWESRAEALEAVFGSVQPRSVAHRTSKASGNEIFFSTHSRAFAERWNGDGIDPEMVDGVALRREWSSADPDAHTYSLLQATWLATEVPTAERRGG